jgi:hypothetical protein
LISTTQSFAFEIPLIPITKAEPFISTAIAADQHLPAVPQSSPMVLGESESYGSESSGAGMAESANVTEVYLALPRNAMAAAAPAVQTAWNEQRKGLDSAPAPIDGFDGSLEIGFQAMPESAAPEGAVGCNSVETEEPINLGDLAMAGSVSVQPETEPSKSYPIADDRAVIPESAKELESQQSPV